MNPSSVPVSLLLFLQSAPYPLIWGAFQLDCARLCLPWYAPAAQRLFVALFLRHPLVRRFPTRLSHRRALLKFVIAALERPRVRAALRAAGAEEPLHAGLVEAYGQLLAAAPEDTHSPHMCYKIFHSPTEETTETTEAGKMAETTEAGKMAETTEAVEMAEMIEAVKMAEMIEAVKTAAALAPVPVRVASGHYGNVGCTLWPSAFALVQLLAQELAAPSPKIIPANGPLRILELGAGVGLTPLMLHRRSEYQRRVDGYMLTDYQLELVDNMLVNLENNGITPADPNTFGTDLISRADQVTHAVDLIDWNELERNEVSLKKWGCNLILAADCVYDVETIESFTSTLRLALLATPGAVAIVVQTHRQETTLKRLFDSIHRANIKVQSYCADLAFKDFMDDPKALILKSEVHTKVSGIYSGGLVARPGHMDDAGTFQVDDSTYSHDSNVEKHPPNVTEQWDGAWIGRSFIKFEGSLGIHVLTL